MRDAEPGSPEQRTDATPGSSAAPTGEKPPRFRALLRRLPLLLVLAVGVWLWKGGGYPAQREILWELGADRAQIREVDIQLSDPGGKRLAKRDQFFFHEPPKRELVQKARLAPGDYAARVFIKRQADQPEEQVSTTVHVGESETVVVWLQP